MKRSEYDASYLASLYQENVVSTEGVFPLDENVICTYIDLDVLIDSAGLSDTESKIVDFLMQGYSLGDIADYLGHARQASDTMLNRAVEKIVARNNQRWDLCYGDKPLSQW